MSASDTMPVTAKICPCGKKYTITDWRSLSLLGYMEDEEDPFLIECRNCSCGSTIAMKVHPPTEVACSSSL